jgi:ABC-type branched-subunit amino acid transport system substrate-binding protein
MLVLVSTVATCMPTAPSPSASELPSPASAAPATPSPAVRLNDAQLIEAVRSRLFGPSRQFQFEYEQLVEPDPEPSSGILRVRDDGTNLTTSRDVGVSTITDERTVTGATLYQRLNEGAWSDLGPSTDLDIDLIARMADAQLKVDGRDAGAVRLSSEPFALRTVDEGLEITVTRFDLTTDPAGRPLSLSFEIEAGTLRLQQTGSFTGKAVESIERPPVEPILEIASTFPWSSTSTDGIDMRRAIDMAIEAWEPRAGWRIQHVALNSSVPPAEEIGDNVESEAFAEAAAVTSAIDERVIAHIGPAFGSTSEPVIRITCAAGLLVVLPHGPRTIYSEDSGVRRDNGMFDRCARGEHNVVQLDAAAESRGFAIGKRLEDEGLKRVWSINDTGAEADVVQHALEAEGVEFLGVSTLPEDQTNHAALLSKIVKAKPDAVLYLGREDSTAFEVWLAASRRLPKARFIATTAVTMDADQTTRPLELIGSVSRDVMPARAKFWAEDFRKRFGESPEYWAFFAFDAAGIVLQALDAALIENPDATLAQLRASIRRSVTGGTKYRGVIHDWAFVDGFPDPVQVSVWGLDTDGYSTLELLSVPAPG